MKFLMGIVKHSQTSQNNKFVISLQYLKKEVRGEAIFSMHINIKVSCKLISKFGTSTFPKKWYYHYQGASSSILQVLKVTSFQYLYNISKKKLRIDFCMQINIKASTIFIVFQYGNCFWVILWCKTCWYLTRIKWCSLLLFLKYFLLRISFLSRSFKKKTFSIIFKCWTQPVLSP